MNNTSNWHGFEIDLLAKSFRRHKKFVTSLKFLLPIIALGLLIALIIYPSLHPAEKKIIIEAAQSVDTTANPPMINPRLSGFDKQNQPFSISAARGYQQAEKQILMEEVAADITLKNGTFASIVTPSALYDIDNKFVSTTDVFEVFITDSAEKSYYIKGKTMQADLTKSVISSTGSLDVETPMGNLKASGFKLFNKDSRIIFIGPVKLVIIKK